MNVLGHDDVAHKGESVAVACFAQDLDKRVSSANGAQEWKTPISSEGDEMEMAASVMANEFVSHGKKEKSKPRPSRSGRIGHPPQVEALL